MQMAEIPVSIPVLGLNQPAIELLVSPSTTAQHVNTFFQGLIYGTEGLEWDLFPTVQLSLFEHCDGQFRRVPDNQQILPIAFRFQRNLPGRRFIPLVMKYDIDPSALERLGHVSGPLADRFTVQQVPDIAKQIKLGQVIHIFNSGLLCDATVSVEEFENLVKAGEMLCGNLSKKLLSRRHGIRSSAELAFERKQSEKEIVHVEEYYLWLNKTLGAVSAFATGDLFLVHEVKVTNYETTALLLPNESDLNSELFLRSPSQGAVHPPALDEEYFVIVSARGVLILSQGAHSSLEQVARKLPGCSDAATEGIAKAFKFSHRYVLDYQAIGGWSCSTTGDVIALSMRPDQHVVHICGISNNWSAAIARKLLLYSKLAMKGDIGAVSDRIPIHSGCNMVVLEQYVRARHPSKLRNKVFGSEQEDPDSDHQLADIQTTQQEIITEREPKYVCESVMGSERVNQNQMEKSDSLSAVDQDTHGIEEAVVDTQPPLNPNKRSVSAGITTEPGLNADRMATDDFKPDLVNVQVTKGYPSISESRDSTGECGFGKDGEHDCKDGESPGRFAQHQYDWNTGALLRPDNCNKSSTGSMKNNFNLEGNFKVKLSSPSPNIGHRREESPHKGPDNESNGGHTVKAELHDFNCCDQVDDLLYRRNLTNHRQHEDLSVPTRTTSRVTSESDEQTRKRISIPKELVENHGKDRLRYKLSYQDIQTPLKDKGELEVVKQLRVYLGFQAFIHFESVQQQQKLANAFQLWYNRFKM